MTPKSLLKFWPEFKWHKRFSGRLGKFCGVCTLFCFLSVDMFRSRSWKMMTTMTTVMMMMRMMKLLQLVVMGSLMTIRLTVLVQLKLGDRHLMDRSCHLTPRAHLLCQVARSLAISAIFSHFHTVSRVTTFCVQPGNLNKLGNSKMVRKCQKKCMEKLGIFSVWKICVFTENLS